MSVETKFSRQLADWGNYSDHSLQSLIDLFGVSSFSILFIVLMTTPALPLPTGGVTHIFEIVTMLLSLELVAGRRSVWLPEKTRRLKLPAGFKRRVLPATVKLIRFFEQFSRPRLGRFLEKPWFLRLVGALVLVLTLSAFLAPPFSGLDTLPSLGVVLMALALVLGDVLLLTAGVLVGTIGIGLIAALGRLVFRLF